MFCVFGAKSPSFPCRRPVSLLASVHSAYAGSVFPKVIPAPEPLLGLGQLCRFLAVNHVMSALQVCGDFR